MDFKVGDILVIIDYADYFYRVLHVGNYYTLALYDPVSESWDTIGRSFNKNVTNKQTRLITEVERELYGFTKWIS